jgi:hypothetical protein
MLAPLEKVESRRNDIVQIVITRKCSVHTCSNCTELLPFRKDAPEMSLECVEEALVSLDGWPGVRAAFGGDPCSHSRFPEVCALWKKHVTNQRQRGLWTSNILRHGSVARDTFWPNGRFNLNVHGNSKAADEMRKWLPGIPIYGETGRIHHGAMLLDRRDFAVSDDEWIALRETCDINQKWSSAVVQGPDGKPRAYFCEVASALDSIRGEDHGVPAVPGWWRQPMEHFQHQVSGCCDRGCGVPLRRQGHQDTDDTYDISKSWLPVIENPRGKVKVQCHEELPPPVHELTDYAGLRLKDKT